MRKGGGFYNEVTTAGASVAVYTGFLCSPNYLRDATAAFASHLKAMDWADLSLVHFLASDTRLASFLRHFPQDAFRAGIVPRINDDGLDNSICPRIDLPGDWESYLRHTLRSNTRQKIRRFLKQVETSGEFRITHATAETVERDLETLLQLWETQWGMRKGERLASIRRVARAMLMDCFDTGALFLPVLWKDGVPVAALASLIDTKNKSLLFYMGGRLQEVNHPPPGLVLHAYSIRAAIAAGLKTYDFLRGNEAYKFSLGAKGRSIRCVLVMNQTGRNRGDRLDRRSLPLLLQQTIALHRAGRVTEAERGYRQALELQPDCAIALYHFGQLMAAKGDHMQAERLFRTVITTEPAACGAWFKLGQSLQAQARFAEAAAAYEAIVKRRPTFPRAYYNLGIVQLALGECRNAIASFEAALHLQPDDALVMSGLAEAMMAAGSAGREPTQLSLP
jgi:tetratricopeptide (TPR) repeat protein